jgi:hypothetical protein
LDQNLADQANAASQPNDSDVDVQIDGLSLTALFYFLSDKPSNIVISRVLPSLRNAAEKPFGSWQAGGPTNLIINPREHHMEMAQDVRGNFISSYRNGGMVSITRDPIKCTGGKIFRKC